MGEYSPLLGAGLSPVWADLLSTVDASQSDGATGKYLPKVTPSSPTLTQEEVRVRCWRINPHAEDGVLGRFI